MECSECGCDEDHEQIKEEARASAVIEWLESEEALTMISHTMQETDILWTPEKGTKDKMFQKILAAKLREGRD